MQNLILAIDIGNTNTSIGIWNKDNLVDTCAISSDIKKTCDEYGILLTTILNHKDFLSEIKGAIISSVVPKLSETFSDAILKYLKIKAINLTHKSKMPVKLNLDNNKEIGADRIANASAAAIKYKLPAIVIDFGTATTFDIVNSNGEFVGGIIAPGLGTQLNSLGRATEKLPELKVAEVENYIGNCTVDAILSGVIRGSACMIDGMLKNCMRELGEKPFIIGTGGYCSIMAKYMEQHFDRIEPDLTLQGLRELYMLNIPNQPVYRTH